jgi:hypothetical protein
MASSATTSKQAETFFNVCHLGRWHREHKTWAGFIAAPHSVQLVATVSMMCSLAVLRLALDERLAARYRDRCPRRVAGQRIGQHHVGGRQFGWLPGPFHRDLLTEILDGIIGHR